MRNETSHQVQPVRFPVSVLLSLAVIVFCILIDACRTEGSIPLLKNIKGDTAVVKAQLHANLCSR